MHVRHMKFDSMRSILAGLLAENSVFSKTFPCLLFILPAHLINGQQTFFKRKMHSRMLKTSMICPCEYQNKTHQIQEQ